MEASAVVALSEHFAALEDPGVERTKLHSLLAVVTFAICAVMCGAVRYCLDPLGLLGAIDPETAEGVERAWGPYGEILDRNAAVQQYTLDLADEARELIQVLSSRRHR